MKICVAQTRSVKGDIQSNIEIHKKFIDLAISDGADVIIFPELSLTGYEPALAKELATDKDDNRFNDFQKISDAAQITIGAGIPTKQPAGTAISLLLFQPHKARQLYSKRYLHSDEEEFFVSGENLTNLIVDKTKVALAICYELSIPAHSEEAFKRGAQIYIASVAKSADGVEKAVKSLSAIAAGYSVPVLMSNSVGPSDNFESAGKSSVWNSQGVLIGQLNETGEGLLIFDPATQQLIEKTI